MGRKVIIVGGGVGSLATAVRLLSKGYQVEIFEKEEQVGGKVNFLKREEYTFDLTASILMTPQIYKEVFTYANKNFEDYLKFIKVEPNYRTFYNDSTSYDFSSDFTKLTETLEKISIEDSAAFVRFLGDSYEKYLIADKYFLKKPLTRFIDFFNPVTLTKALNTKTFSTTYDYLKKFIKDEKLIKYICFQAMYVGISPYEGPNIYTLVPTISELYGLWYIKGGMYTYIKALEKVIYELGGKINTKAEVEEVLINGKRAYGIRVNNNIEKADLVICNSDFSYTMNALIKDKNAKGKYKENKLSKMKYSCGTFIIYLGLKKKYPILKVHNLYLGEDFEKNIQAPFVGNLPEKPSLYIYCSSSIDEEMAPKGKETLNIMVRVPNLLFNNLVWTQHTIKEFRNSVINTLKNIKGLEDIEENIEVEHYLTPMDMMNCFNSYGGASFGLSHTLAQTNYFRPSIKSPKIKNLYFVGESVHPGTGVSIILNCSKIVTEEILKNNLQT